jgi:hypothetical protein
MVFNGAAPARVLTSSPGKWRRLIEAADWTQQSARSEWEVASATSRLKRLCGIFLAVVLSVGGGAAALAQSAPAAGVPTDDEIRAFALQWYEQMQAGKIDRNQYTAAYSAQLTDDAAQAMSHHLNEYGASPLHAEIMQKRSIDNQTFYRVKLIFPRGDAASVLFGFDAAGKITGIAVESMAGD